MDGFAGLLDLGIGRSANGLDHALELVLLDGFDLALNERLVPLDHEILNGSKVVLHRFENLVDDLNLLHRLGDELLDAGGAPVELDQASFNDVVELLEVRSDQGLLDGEELGQHAVVHVDNEIEVAGPSAEN